MTEVTLIIPAFIRNDKDKKFLKQSIDSVKNQTFKDFEIIVVDDCSPIDISEFATCKNNENRGIGYTRQKGIEMAGTKYICFLSHDDIFDPVKLETNIEIAKLFPNHVQYSDYYYLDEYGNTNGLFDAPYKKRKTDFINLVRKWADRLDMFINFSTLFAPRKCFETVPIEDLRICEDLAWVLKACELFDFICIKKPLTSYRIHRNMTTLRSGSEAIRIAMNILEKSKINWR